MRIVRYVRMVAKCIQGFGEETERKEDHIGGLGVCLSEFLFLIIRRMLWNSQLLEKDWAPWSCLLRVHEKYKL